MELRPCTPRVRACVLSHFSHVQLFVTPWTVALQAPPSMGFFLARALEWVATPSSRGSSRPRDQPESPVSFALQVHHLPLSHPGRPYVVTEPQFESYSKFPLAIYFTCGNVCFHVALSIHPTLCPYGLDVSDTNN